MTLLRNICFILVIIILLFGCRNVKNTSESLTPKYNKDSLLKVAENLNNIVQTQLDTSSTCLTIRIEIPGFHEVYLIPDGIYNFEFKNRKDAATLRILEITKDSLSLTGSFNEKVSLQKNYNPDTLNCSILDIKSVRFLRQGNKMYSKMDFDKSKVEVLLSENEICKTFRWYKLNEKTGMITEFYYFTTTGGYFTIREENGTISW